MTGEHCDFWGLCYVRRLEAHLDWVTQSLPLLCLPLPLPQALTPYPSSRPAGADSLEMEV